MSVTDIKLIVAMEMNEFVNYIFEPNAVQLVQTKFFCSSYKNALLSDFVLFAGRSEKSYAKNATQKKYEWQVKKYCDIF